MEETDISKLKITTQGAPKPKGKGRLWWAVATVTALFALTFILRLILGGIEVKVRPVSLSYPSQGLTLFNASGYVVAARKAAAASKATGRLVELRVEEGARVKKNDVIARLENDDVAAAKEQAAAMLNVSKKRLEQAQAELDDARVNLSRSRELLSGGYTSQSAFDSAEARHKKALAAAEAAEAEVQASQASLKSANAALENTIIRAPFDAVVLTKNADIGDIITPLGAAANAKAAVVTIADMGSLEVEADVSESSIFRVAINQPCEITLDAMPQARFKGQVHMIVPTASRSTASVLVRVRFVDKDPRILPEMSAKVAFMSRQLTSAEQSPFLTVPFSAVVQKDGAAFVFIEGNGRVAQTQVATGRKTGSDVEITAGLQQGERVVINPPKGLPSGAKVKVTEE